MSEIMCKGTWSLKTACGKCKRCHDSAAEYIKGLEADFEMYVRAWQREVGNHMRNKAHLIDALVLTTQDLRRKADRFDREFTQDLPKHIYAALCAPWFTP